MTNPSNSTSQKHEPIFNFPTIIGVILVLLILVQGVWEWVLGDDGRLSVILWFSFIPGRLSEVNELALPFTANYWTPVTYALLHADWMHLALNGFWFLAFGSAVARKMGALRFIVFCCLAAASGAAFHILSHWNQLVPVIGASGVVSACMGAACRFAFVKAGYDPSQKDGLAILSIRQTFSHSQTLIFMLVWLVINYLFGSGVVDITGQGASIAWEAHLGGFLFGLLALPLFAQRQNIPA
jgi:membrane associated rhomboid family serine protease